MVCNLSRIEGTALKKHSLLQLSYPAHRQPTCRARIFQRFTIISAPLAAIAGDIDIWQEMHLDLDNSVTLTGLAPAALDIKAETARRIAARFRFWQAGKPFSYWVKAPVGSRIGTRCSPDRGLANIYHLVQQLNALNLAMRGRDFRLLCKRRDNAFHKVSKISVDLPPPDTPVTQVNTPSGISASTDFRLLPLALLALSSAFYPACGVFAEQRFLSR